MRQIYSWFIGLGVGAAVAAALVTLFVPASAGEVRARLKEGYRETLTDARRASQQRRAELEAELRGRRR
jgi:gas vesicle protein